MRPRDHVFRMAGALLADFNMAQADPHHDTAHVWAGALRAARRSGGDKSPSAEQIVAAALRHMADHM